MDAFTSTLLAPFTAPDATGRIGILGGTFDPPHNAHRALAQASRDALQLDRLLVMPAGNPAFKRDRTIAPAPLRLEMCREAFEGLEGVFVSPWEAVRPGVTYAVDTLSDLKRVLSDKVEVFFVLGADAALSLPRWNDAQHLGTLATFAVALRPPRTFSPKDMCALGEMGFSVETFPFPLQDVSSSEVRRRVREGKSIDTLVNPAVAAIIAREGLYGKGKVMNRCLDKTFYDERKAELQKRVGPRRFAHSLGVSDTACKLAEIYGADEQAALLAGLLHDWDKGYDDPGILARACELNLPLTDELRSMPRVLHGITAAAALKRDFPEIPDEVLSAVKHHTLGEVAMSDLDKIIYIADALEPGRKGDRVKALRKTIGEISLNELFLNVYAYWVELIMERRHPMYSRTGEIWNSYMPDQEVFHAEPGADPMPYNRS